MIFWNFGSSSFYYNSPDLWLQFKKHHSINWNKIHAKILSWLLELIMRQVSLWEMSLFYYNTAMEHFKFLHCLMEKSSNDWARTRSLSKRGLMQLLQESKMWVLSALCWCLVWVLLDENEQVFFLISGVFMNRCLLVSSFPWIDACLKPMKTGSILGLFLCFFLNEQYPFSFFLHTLRRF